MLKVILNLKERKLFQKEFHQNKKVHILYIKELNDDYDIFQYLKNERNNPPVSLHVTSV